LSGEVGGIPKHGHGPSVELQLVNSEAMPVQSWWRAAVCQDTSH